MLPLPNLKHCYVDVLKYFEFGYKEWGVLLASSKWDIFIQTIKFKLAHFNVYLWTPGVKNDRHYFVLIWPWFSRLTSPLIVLSQSYLILFVHVKFLIIWCHGMNQLKRLSHTLFSEIIYRMVFEVMLLSNVFEFIILLYYVWLYLKAFLQ